jgi:nucleotide-binding universal stress UspA family protein
MTALTASVSRAKPPPAAAGEFVEGRSIVCVPRDPSMTDPAVIQALRLARAYQARLHVVHRLGWPPSGERPPFVRVALAGDPVGAIAEYSARVNGRAIVVGNLRRRDTRYRSPAGFATALGAAASCPTLIVPADAAPAPDSGERFQRILCAIDFSDSSLRALDVALAMTRDGAGRLTVLHVLDNFPYEPVYSPARALRLMRDYHARALQLDRRIWSLIPAGAADSHAVDVNTVSGLAADAIVAEADSLSADLLVLGLSRRRRLDDFVSGSTTKKVARRAKTPVLLVSGSTDPTLFEAAVGGYVAAAEPGAVPAGG